MRRLLFLIAFSAWSAAAFAQNQLVFLGPTQNLGAGVSSGQFVVERRVNGLPSGSGTLTVTLTSNRPTGEFNNVPSANTGWAPTRTLSFASGDTQKDFVYRDGVTGLSQVTATATGYPNAVTTFQILPEVISDDFDHPTLTWTDTPAGIWQYAYLSPSTSNSIATSPAAVHRGDGGLRTVDTASSGAFDDEADLGTNLQDTAPKLYLRGWFQMSQPSSTGNETALAVHLNIGGGSPGLSISVDPTGHFCLTGHNAAGVFSSAPCTVVVNANQWYLLEGALENLGTDAGQRTLWIDGTQVATQTVDWSAKSAQGFSFGNAWGEPRDFTGTMDWDDMRVTLYPPASTFKVITPAQVEVGSCVPATLSLVDSRGSPAPAPYDVVADLLTINAGVWGQSDCDAGSLLSTLTIVKGTTGSSFFVSAGALGTANVVAGQPDFVIGTATFEGVPPGTLSDGGVDGGLADSGTSTGDGGSTDGGNGLLADGGLADGGGAGPASGDGGQPDGGEVRRASDRVGCDCDQSSGISLISALVFALAIKRARRGQPPR